MNFKIDRTLLTLSDVFAYMTVAHTLLILQNFTSVSKSLRESKDIIVANTFEFDENVEEIAAISEQLEYLDKNIKTLEEAILCHESKCIEKRIGLGKLQNVGLN